MIKWDALLSVEEDRIEGGEPVSVDQQHKPGSFFSFGLSSIGFLNWNYG
ncbi:hypothetical protein [Gimesia algae]|nr:hypothetical protein [Gimesia algae]